MTSTSCVANGGSIDGCDPCRDGVVADNGVSNVGAVQGGGGTEQPLAHLFHGIHHPLKEIDGY